VDVRRFFPFNVPMNLRSLLIMSLGWMLASCAGKAPGPSHPPQTTAPSSSRHIPLWLTDGSPSQFTDTGKIEAVKTPGVLGFIARQPYEGWPDRVYAGKGELPYTTGGFDIESEFVLLFDRPLVEISSLNEKTSVIVLGLMETKTLRNLTGTARIAWSPSSVGNNLLTDWPGQRATFAELKRGVHDSLTVKTEFRTVSGRTVVHSATMKDVDRNALLPYAQGLQQYLRSSPVPGAKLIRAINLGAHGSKSGYVNEPARVFPNAVAALLRWPCMTIAQLDAGPASIPELARDSLIRSVMSRKGGAASNGKMTVKLIGSDGRLLGSGVMSVH